MRFKITREVWVDVDSVEQLEELNDRAEAALDQVVAGHAATDVHGARSGSVLEGLDDDARAALETLDVDE